MILFHQWHYKYADLRPWDIRNDVRQYESSYQIQTKTRHQAPIVRTASIVSSEPLHILKTESRSSLAARRALSSIQNVASTPDGVNSDSSADNETLVSSSKWVFDFSLTRLIKIKKKHEKFYRLLNLFFIQALWSTWQDQQTPRRTKLGNRQHPEATYESSSQRIAAASNALQPQRRFNNYSNTRRRFPCSLYVDAGEKAIKLNESLLVTPSFVLSTRGRKFLSPRVNVNLAIPCWMFFFNHFWPNTIKLSFSFDGKLKVHNKQTR